MTDAPEPAVGGSRPDISAVTVTYNSAGVVEHGLRSVLDHAGPRLAEIIAVDNASTDSTREVVAALAQARAAEAGPPLRLIASEKNAGYGTSANAGAREAGPGSRYLLLMNPDITLRAGAVDEMASVLDRDPSVGLAGPRQEHSDEYGHPSPTSNPFWLAGIAARLTGGRVGRVRPGSYRASILVMGYCGLARRSAFEQAGGFDEGLFLYMEEPVLATRLRRAGYKVVYVWTRNSVGHFQNTSTAPPSGDPAIRGRRKIELYLASERHLVQHYLPAWLPWYNRAIHTAPHRFWIRYVERELVGKWETTKQAPRST